MEEAAKRLTEELAKNPDTFKTEVRCLLADRRIFLWLTLRLQKQPEEGGSKPTRPAKLQRRRH